MAVANKIGKDFQIIQINFLLSNSLYKISNRNTVKLSHSTIPDVASLINKSNIRNNQCTEPPKCNCTDKTNCPLKEKCQIEYIVSKGKVYGRGPKDSNVNRNVKKVYVGSSQGNWKKKRKILQS